MRRWSIVSIMPHAWWTVCAWTRPPAHTLGTAMLRRRACVAMGAPVVLPPPRSLSTTALSSSSFPTHATVRDVLESSIRELQDASIDEAEESVYHVLAKVLDLSWETGYRELRQVHQTMASPDHGKELLAERQLSHQQITSFSQLLERRKRHEPIQYLVGQWDFMDHVFHVEPPLLCPRPETEELVQHVIQCAKNYNVPPATRRILDIGCGTGCIGISLAHALPDSHVTALDVEPRAVETSRHNARRILTNSPDGERYQALLCSVENFAICADENQRFDFVVSNPPYIPARDMDALDPVVAQWESHQALCGGDDGMEIIRTIIMKLPQWTKQGADCWMEVDPSHPALLQDWLSREGATLGVEFVESVTDMQGLDRFVHVRTTREGWR